MPVTEEGQKTYSGAQLNHFSPSSSSSNVPFFIQSFPLASRVQTFLPLKREINLPWPFALLLSWTWLSCVHTHSLKQLLSWIQVTSLLDPVDKSQSSSCTHNYNREEQIWLHTGSVSFTWTFVFCCFCSKNVAYSLTYTGQPILKALTFSIHIEIKSGRTYMYHWITLLYTWD